MIFGRGGGGGIVNRVTKRPGANAFISSSGSADTYGAWYIDTDINQPISQSASARLNAVYEEFNSNRDFYDGRRLAINPTFAVSLGGTTRIDLGFEYNNDKRTIDRGVPSAAQGSLTSPSRPLTGFRDTFFGVPGFNVSDFEAKVLSGRIEHRFSDNLTVTSRVLYGDYDKLYRNTFAVTPATPRGAVQSVGLEAYRGRLREGAESYAKDLGQRYSPVRLMCSHPNGETWASRSGAIWVPLAARVLTTSPSFMVFQNMMMAASRFIPAMR
jgi:catecholate siderophore receptor